MPIEQVSALLTLMELKGLVRQVGKCAILQFSRTKLITTISMEEVLGLEAYCVKCKTKREMQDQEPFYTNNGTPASRGTCPVCGTRLNSNGAHTRS